MHVGPLALVAPEVYDHDHHHDHHHRYYHDDHHRHHHHDDDRLIRHEIHSYSAEAEALRAERRAEKELRLADRIRMSGDARTDEGWVELYDGETEVAEVRKDRKGRMSLVVPRGFR